MASKKVSLNVGKNSVNAMPTPSALPMAMPMATPSKAKTKTQPSAKKGKC